MATQLETVVLTGKFKGEPITMQYSRMVLEGKNVGWSLVISYHGDQLRYQIRNNSDKPCWAVGLSYLAGEAQKPRPQRIKEGLARDKRRLSGLKVVKP